MDPWPPEFPLPAVSRAEAPDLDIDSLLDFASQSLQPTLEPPSGVKSSPPQYHDESIPMPFIALPIHRGSSFTGRKHGFPRDLSSAPITQDQEDERRKNWAAIGEAKSSSEDDRQHTAVGGDNSIHALREKNRRAQRKFRERQKQKLADSEGKALELKRELEQLRLEKSKLETRNSLLEKLVTMKGGGALTMFSDVDGAIDVQTAQPKKEAFSQVLHLTVKGEPQSISFEELKQLPYAKLTRLWKEYVDEMRFSLEQAGGDEASPAGKRVVMLIDELRLVLTCLMSANPHGMSSLRALKMDPDGAGSTMELPPPELHANILQAIKLSARQRRAAVAYRNHLLSRMGATLRQRRDISLQLLRTLGAQQLPADQQTAAGTVLAQGQIAACRAAEDLRNNIRDEQELYNHFLMAVRSLLTPIQSAIAISHAWPWFPDALTLFNSVAKEEGAPAEQELLACPTPESLPGLPDLTAMPPASLLVVKHDAS